MLRLILLSLVLVVTSCPKPPPTMPPKPPPQAPEDVGKLVPPPVSPSPEVRGCGPSRSRRGDKARVPSEDRRGAATRCTILGRGMPLRRSPGARPGARFCSPVARGCQGPGDLPDVRHYLARPHLERRPAPDLLSQGHALIALFGRIVTEKTGAPRAVPVPVVPVDGIAPGEVGDVRA